MRTDPRVASPSATAVRSGQPRPPEWIARSNLLTRAHGLAEQAHRGHTRATDGRAFLDHVVEVARLLHEAGFDEELLAIGLLHDSVERGTLTRAELESAMGDEIAAMVMLLSEDQTIESFAERKAALRQQVAGAGGRAITVFAADKFSDILGLRRGIKAFGAGVEERMGTSVTSMAGHYRDSVDVIADARPGSTFLPLLRIQLTRLGAEAPAAAG